MSPSEIEQLVLQHFTGAEVSASGDGSHFKVRVISEQFDGLRPVKRQQMVYASVNEQITSGALHALQIEAYTPTEWEKAKRLQLN